LFTDGSAQTFKIADQSSVIRLALLAEQSDNFSVGRALHRIGAEYSRFAARRFDFLFELLEIFARFFT
jgi:hypothetical protein